MTHSEPAREAVREPYAKIVKRLLNPPFGTETSERLLMGTAADAIRTLLDEVAELHSENEDLSIKWDLATRATQEVLVERGAAAQQLRDLEDAILACETGHVPNAGALIANYRTVRRTIQDTRAALASPAATSAETQGGDGVLPCDVAVAPATIIRKGCQVSTLMLAIKQREGRDVGEVSDAARAALAPSTSAATRGEPVALNRQAIRDAIAAASRSGAMGWADHEIDEATDDLVDALAHPAPAESAQVKVKPLVWLDNGHGLYSADEGRYVVDATRAAEDSKVLLLLPCAPTERFDRVVDAIAAAQTKQEAAIRASLATDAEG